METWAEGYDDGQHSKGQLFAKPPLMLTDKAKEKWKEGWKAGKADANSGVSQHQGGGPAGSESYGPHAPAAPADGQVATGNHEWLAHQNAAGLVADRRLQIRYDGLVQGIQWFRDDAGQMITETIKKPPGKISFFGTFVEMLIPALEVLLPEEGLAIELFTVGKTLFETAKPGTELVDKMKEEIVANTVEEAQKHMAAIVNQFAEDVIDKAGPIHQTLGKEVPEALRAYVDAHPQHFSDDDAFHNQLVDAIGLTEPDLGQVKKKAYDKAFPAFKAELLKTTAQMHFFHDLDSDGERFKFLVEHVIKVGTDPDQFLTLIGANKARFDKAIALWRQYGANDEATQIIAVDMDDDSGSVINPLSQ
jgi:hypothetical protein